MLDSPNVGTAKQDGAPSAGPESESEQFAVRWISANYEEQADQTIEQSDLYKHYMVAMSQFKRERLSPQTFAYCVR